MSSPVPFIMPERVAKADPTSPITDPTGSGPFRFLAEERVAGSRAAYARFDRYVPRDEPPDGHAGGKQVRVPSVEWITIPDAGTAMAALQAGEIDWLEQPSVDLVGLVARDPQVVVSSIVPGGIYALLRFNHLFPPFDDPVARRAVLAAVDQETYLQAVVGGAGASRECKAYIPCGMPLSTGAGGDIMAGSLDQGRALLRRSRYDGHAVVVITPSGLPATSAMGQVSADLLARFGMRVDHQVMDWGTLLTRRNGPWWRAWSARRSPQVPYVPLGQYDQPTAYRRSLTGVVSATAPVMWGVSKA